MAATGVVLALAVLVRAVPALNGTSALRLGGVVAGPRGGRPTLLYLFHRADCQRHVALQRRWRALGRSGRLSVVGIELDPPLAAASGGPPNRVPGAPGMPLRNDLRREAERVLVRTGYTTTPVSVLLDSLGRPRLILPAPADSGDVAAQEAALRAALETW